jgi:DNA-binding response OmpR family regulator
MSGSPAGIRILLLEDDDNLGMIIQESLELRGYAVTLCRDGAQGLAAFADQVYTLCLVDVMMPAVDGFAFAAEVRGQGSDVPLIFLTARSLVEDRIEGFRIGCDDYVTKPFSMEELLLRIEAVLRRGVDTATSAPLGDSLALGAYVYDSPARTLSRGDERRQLTEREAELLELLYRHRNRTLDRSRALLDLWGDDSYHNGRSMDVFISRLRKYLSDDDTVEIRTVHGQGFRLVVKD